MADALLTDPANGVFTLGAGSPAINEGVALAGLTIDYDGTTRADPPDIGALEVV